MGPMIAVLIARGIEHTALSRTEESAATLSKPARMPGPVRDEAGEVRDEATHGDERPRDAAQPAEFAQMLAALEMMGRDCATTLPDEAGTVTRTMPEGVEKGQAPRVATLAGAMPSDVAGAEAKAGPVHKGALDSPAFRPSPVIDAAAAPRSARAHGDASRFDVGHTIAASREAATPANRAGTTNDGGASRGPAAAPRGPEQMGADKVGVDKPADASGTQGPGPAAALQPDSARAGSPLAVARDGPVRWGPQLLSALGERVDVQLQRGVEQAVIRLDPQSMGTLHIAIRHEGGAIQIQMVASHEDVARQLQAVGDALRQELSSKQHGDVTVVVRHGQGMEQGGQGGRGGDAREQDARPGDALAEADLRDGDPRFRLDGRDMS